MKQLPGGKQSGNHRSRGSRALGAAGALAAAVLVCLPASPAQADLAGEVRASRAQLKGFGYVQIKQHKWCLTSAEAEMMIVTSGRPIGETYFASRDPAECQLLWQASLKNLRVDLSALANQTITDPVFIGSVKKVYVIGYVWTHMR